jgi:hypothetical protein
LNLLSHNRFVFVASFALLSLIVVGLDVLWQASPARRWWFLVPITLLLVLAVWLSQQISSLPEPLATVLEKQIRQGYIFPTISNDAELQQARARYFYSHFYGLLLCCLALAGWGLLWYGRAGAWFRPVLATLLVGELLLFGYGRNPQCSPELYYPRLPLLERIAEATPGRVIGMRCLPANLSMSHNLRDIRGYDSIDPRPLIELLDPVRHSGNLVPEYARLQHYLPTLSRDASGEARLPPVLDMLGVRFMIFRGTPPPNARARFMAPDYWAIENEHALSRVFVPERIEPAPASDRLIELLTSPRFDPRAAVYVEEAPSLPTDCRGKATLVREMPTEVVVNAEMETPGLVVLSDMWFEGWHAYRDEVAVQILRTNHCLRGVLVPAGKSTIVFRYEPSSFARGTQLLLVGAALMGVWLAACWWQGRRSRDLISEPEA